MHRRIGLPAGIAVIALVVGGCTGDDEPTEPTEPAPVAQETNPCEFVPAEVIDSVNPRDETPVNTLLIGELVFDGCTIGDVYDVSFGVLVVDDGSEVQDHLIGGGPDGPEPIDVGDEAYRSEIRSGGQTAGVSMVARFDEHVVLVRNDSLGNSNEAVRVSEEETMSLLEAVGDSVPDGYEEDAQTAAVGEGCLDADAESITTLTGNVHVARGGTVDERVRCTYRGDGGQTLSVSVAPANNASELYQARADSERVEEIEIAGTERAVVASEGLVDGAFQPTDDEVGYFTFRLGPDEDPPAGRDALAAMLEEFVAEG